MGLTAVRFRSVSTRVRAVELLETLPASAAILAVVYTAVFLAHVPGLGLYVDDWDHLQGVLTTPVSSLITTFPMDYRPFDELPWLILGRTSKTNLVPYYLAFFALRYVTSMLLYLFVRKVAGSAMFALGCAIVWSLYPSDTSVFWLTSFAYRFGAAFLLASATLLVTAPAGRTYTAYYSAAVLCCLLCLLSNEIFLGLCACLPAVAWMGGEISVSQRVRKAVPFEIAICGYLAYREWIGPRVLHFVDPKPTGLTLAPGQVAIRLLRAGFVELMGGWMAAAAGVAGSSSAVLVAVFCVLVWLLGFSALLMFRDRSRPARSVGARSPESEMTPGPRWVLFGLAVMLAGYVPLVFTDVPPALGEIASRVNAAGSIGAALFFVGIAWVLAHRPTLTLKTSRTMFLAAVCVLAIGGVAMQEHSANTYVRSWAAQRAFWRSTVRVVHAMRTNSTIVLLAPHVVAWDTVQSLPPASFQAAFALMYPRSNIGGIVLLRRELKSCGGMGLLENGVVRTVQLGRTGFRYLDTRVLVPYSNVVVLEYSAGRPASTHAVSKEQNTNSPCRIHGNVALLRGQALATSPWYGLAVSGK